MEKFLENGETPGEKKMEKCIENGETNAKRKWRNECKEKIGKRMKKR